MCYHDELRSSSEVHPQARAPSLSPDLFSGLEHSLRKLTLNLRVGSRNFDGSLSFVPDIKHNYLFIRVLPDSIWGLERLEELETDLCSSRAAARGQERQARRVQLERRTALRVIGFNEAAAAGAGTTATADVANVGNEEGETLDEPRFAGFKQLTSLTLTSDQWLAPPPSLRHHPSLTRLHMPLAAPSLSSRPGVGLWHLTSLKDLCISEVDRGGVGERQQQQQQEQQEQQQEQEQGQGEPQGEQGQEQAQTPNPFRPPSLESLTLHGRSYSEQGLSPWACSTITQLKLVNVRCPPVPESQCLFPNLRVFQAIHSTAQVGALPNLRHMLERAEPGSEIQLTAHPNLTFLQVDRPCSKHPIPSMPRLEILILDQLFIFSRTLECLSFCNSLRFLRLSNVGAKRGCTGNITCPPKLRTLEIHESRFPCLPKSFACFHRIRKLRLIHCEQMKSLPEYLAGFNRLTEVTIRGCKRKIQIL
ncbi:unnamed protein product, partial [Closterium sp. NIES-53]